LARQLLAQADRHFASAAIPGVDLDSRFGMLYDAARKAADAIMRAGGRRVTQGIRHHIVFFEEAKRLLPAADSGLVARVEGARNTRNATEYQAREVTQTEVDELTNAATHFHRGSATLCSAVGNILGAERGDYGVRHGAIR